MKTIRKPNIILINCDDLGYGDLGCFGSPRNKTPHLDRMAAEGMRFTDFHMASSICSPSRASMLTGCYPKRINVPNVLFPGNDTGLNPDETTIASALKQAGYTTRLIGKWHCGDQPAFLPTELGFDGYYGLPYSNDMGRQAGRDDDRQFPPLPLLRDSDVIEEQPEQGGLTERYVEDAVRFIRENRDGPFFLYFAHMYVHLPLYVPERFRNESANGAYGAAVACIDWAAGALLHELRRLGIDQDTMVLFTSDNGSRADERGGSNAPLRGAKFSSWEGGFRLPFIVRWPGVVPAGTECHELVTSMDFLPTLAAMTGVTLPSDRVIDGKNVLPLWLGEEGATSPHEHFLYYDRLELNAVRKGQWKLFVHRRDADGIEELYDLKSDIGELHDVSADHPETVQQLQVLAARARAELGDACTGQEGSATRPCGRVDTAKPLTDYNPEHPYIIAMYDLEDRG